jgi:hypothetical protein
MLDLWNGHSGYVALASRDSGEFKQKMFAWPAQKEEVQKFLDDHRDLHFSPQVFSQPSRSRQSMQEVSCILADLDDTPPQILPVPPSAYWETSPGRWQAVWQLDRPLPVEEAVELSRSVSYRFMADMGGWGPEHTLRVPDSWNAKRACTAGPLHRREPVSPEALKDAPSVYDDLCSVYNIPANVQEMWRKDPPQGKRSEFRFSLEHELKHLGVSKDAVFVLVWNAPCCKFRQENRPPEDLRKEIAKVFEEADEQREKQFDILKCIVPSDIFIEGVIKPKGWLLEGLWQESSYGIMSGQPKIGKTWLATDIALSIVAGRHTLDGSESKSGDVIYWNAENGDDGFKFRIAKIASRKGLISHGYNSEGHITLQSDWRGSHHLLCIPRKVGRLLDLSTVEWQNQFCRALQFNHEKPALVIIDPLVNCIGGADENSAKEMMPVLKFLMGVTETTGVSIMVLHHTKKGKTDTGGQNMRGTSALHGWVDSALYMEKLEKGGDGVCLQCEFRDNKSSTLWYRMEIDPKEPYDLVVIQK